MASVEMQVHFALRRAVNEVRNARSLEQDADRRHWMETIEADLEHLAEHSLRGTS